MSGSFIPMLRVLVKNTLADLYRQKIFYNVLFIVLFLVFAGYLSSLLVFGHQERVMLHLGTTVISLTLMIMASIFGARVIYQDIDQRTIYLPLSRPISRSAYLLARVGGVGLFLIFNLALLFGVLVMALYWAGGEWRWTWVQWAYLTAVESWVFLGLSLFFSFWMRPGLNSLCSMTFLFLSHNHDLLVVMQEKGGSSGFFEILQALTLDGSRFLLDTRVYYDLPLATAEMASRTLYGAVWFGMLTLISCFIFYRKNL